MAPILVRPGLRRLERTARPKRSVHFQPAATWRTPELRRPAPPRRVPRSLAFRSPPPSLPAAVPGSSAFAAVGDLGPNPYAGFSRSFTDAGGIRLGFFVKDERAWRWWLHAAVWLMAMAATLWCLAYLSPYPLVPRGCRLFAACPVSLPERQVLINFLLLAGAGMLYASFLFGEKWRPASVEIRPDCMIIDDADVFWQRHMELGWPELGYDYEREATVLRGVYGTRVVVYLVLHASDEQDRTIQIIGAHLQFAMQQLWEQPGVGS